MNKTEVIILVSEKTGMPQESCEKIVKAFEKQSEESLTNRLKGEKHTHEDKLAGIAEKSGFSIEECGIVLNVLDEVMDTGLSKKLLFFK